MSSHFDEAAAALFVTHLKRAHELRAEGGLSDAHTMTSWALQQTRAEIHHRNR